MIDIQRTCDNAKRTYVDIFVMSTVPTVDNVTTLRLKSIIILYIVYWPYM